MRIAILGAVNIKHMTQISHYLNNIDLKKHDVDIIYVDKYGIEENISGVNMRKYSIKIDRDWSFVKKAMEYYRFKSFANPLLKKNKYDLVIVWGTYTAHLFKKELISHYRNRYILNIRDYFFERNFIIKKRLAALINNSKFVTLSSEGFLKFLPKSEKYIIIYSINKNLIENARKSPVNSKPIRISFIGNNRFFEVNHNLLNAFKNDKRFILQYFGTHADILETYAQENNILNAKFVNGFPIEDTVNYLNETDILNNVYGNKNIALDTALSIRLGYAIYLNKPIITSPDTFTSDKAKQVGLGFDVDFEKSENIPDKVYEWYNSLDYSLIKQMTDKEQQKMDRSNQEFYQVLKRTVADEIL